MLEAAFTPIEQPLFTQAPQEPEWFAKQLLRLGGLSPTGFPMLRVVWSGQAQKMFRGTRVLAYPDKRERVLIGQNEHNNGRILFHPAGGAETEFLPDSLIVEPVFDWVDATDKPHWVLECWTPSSELVSGWDSEIQGPFPGSGVYQIVVHIATPQMTYAPLNEATWQSIAAIWAHLLASETENPHLPNTDEQQALRLTLTREREAQELALRDKTRADDSVHLCMENRRRLHDAVRADFG